MNPEETSPNKSRSSSKRRRRKRLLLFLLPLVVGLLVLVGGWAIALLFASTEPVGTYLVLGGSIKREMYVANKIAKQHPETPILISAGASPPCVIGLLDRAGAPKQQVWLESCARSTFGNFYFGLPILEKWQVRHVKVVTSKTHLPRAKWLAQIILGSHGIWVEMEIVPEIGVPGNTESWLKTVLDVTRSLVWAGVSQVADAPECSKLVRLTEVNLERWCEKGFSCEHQAQLKQESVCSD
jgi:uncharacterized SAM-binding protein YcdF (DUF218 family)